MGCELDGAWLRCQACDASASVLCVGKVARPVAGRVPGPGVTPAYGGGRGPVGTPYIGTTLQQHTRAAAVASRARAVPTAYEALARDLDERCHGVRGDAVRAGVVGAGPVLRLLRSYPECVGLVFGAFGEASPSVHELCAHVAKVGSEQGWRRMGARSAAEAYGFLVGRLRRSWGVAVVRAAAHLRACRVT